MSDPPPKTEVSDKEIFHPEIEKVAKIFRALAYPKRLEVLMALLTEGTLEFAQLLAVIKLGKTALANHLAELEKIQLISKPRRGLYEITERGKRFLKVNTSLYDEVEAMDDPAEVLDMYTYKNPFEIPDAVKTELRVSFPAQFQDHTNSFTGCLAGVLTSLGQKIDAVEVCGFSGLAFLVRYYKDYMTSGSRYTSGIWPSIMQAVEGLGYKIEYLLDSDPYPTYFNTITLEDLARAQKFFRLVKRYIREKDRPVIIWGGDIPEYYIINGIQQNHYVMHGYHSVQHITEHSIRFDSISSPRYMHVFFLNGEFTPRTEESDRQAIKRAVEFAEGTTMTDDQFVSGPDALKLWAFHLGHYEDQPSLVNVKGNNYMGEYYLIQFGTAAEYLERMVEKYPRKTRNHYLSESAEAYRAAEKRMFKFNTLFPYDFFEEAHLKDPKSGATLLLQVSEDLRTALKALKSAEVMW
ncbi:MAG: ArsR/SmtB family transcription factor [Promethearchaeota archaeon]